MNQKEVLLRDILDPDLPILFTQQLDPEAIHMAAFTSKDPTDRDAFITHWTKIRADESITIQAVLFDGQLAGSILVHSWFGEPEISYWLGKEVWGKGIATEALALFLEQVTTRPLYGRVAKDNIASIRVMEKCGFKIVGEDKGFANGRGIEIEELILKLDASEKIDGS